MPKYLITSALPYINGIKHLGNLIGSLLPADVYARHLRQEGEEVLYICGTDEHGTPAELAAAEHDQPIQDYCESMFHTQAAIYKQFRLSFDYFGRSSDSENHALTRSIFTALDKNGYIETRDIQQIYSLVDKRYLPDRYVQGRCPHCQYERARGDQCESCGRLLNPTDLLDPQSAISGSRAIELRSTPHLFLQLNALEQKVQTWVDSHTEWPTVTKGIAKKWLKEGLRERCITRDLEWGVKVPKAGFENKVFYVWFDAPNAYIAMTEAWAKQTGHPDTWRVWWSQSEEIQYAQFMAKDNVPFHAIFWPAMLLGTGENWKLADTIKSFSWLTYEGGKFSTSQKRGVFTDQALELFPADYWRYYLLSIAPEDADSDFTFEDFAQTINKDLADVLGNFVGRVTALVNKYFSATVPIRVKDVPAELKSACGTQLTLMNQSLRDCKFRQAAQQLRALWVIGNEFITTAEPWKVMKTDAEKGGEILNTCLHLIRLFAIATTSFTPTIAETLFEIIGISSKPETFSFKEALDFDALKAGASIFPHPVLFTKIQPEQVEQLKSDFSGIP
ncbi:MAG TPA: methionine--tRNA ligase [Coxiellaceae bacterium]|nr:methionine--tRNA ligase [Coxiellaceae bacterium]